MRVQDHSILTQLMNKYKKARMDNKGALNEFASERFNAPRKKKSFKSKKLVGKKFNASVHYTINE